ncbi:MAG: sigma-70 family RNA polymerase sigma factor [Proteobacteria bacterium]|nr:sigma-70 family RNA polymerase sigma factor [Pseudomonadota bacterium]
MEQSLHGDTCAYHELLLLLTGALRKMVRSRARAAGLDAEDIVQEVLLALHLKRSTWVAGTPVAPWVAAIARNKIVDAFRRHGRYAAIPIESVTDVLSSEQGLMNPGILDLERGLAALSQRQRDVVRAVSLEGHSAQEVGERLSISEGAVRVMLHRSVRALARILNPVLDED